MATGLLFSRLACLGPHVRELGEHQCDHDCDEVNLYLDDRPQHLGWHVLAVFRSLSFNITNPTRSW